MLGAEQLAALAGSRNPRAPPRWGVCGDRVVMPDSGVARVALSPCARWLVFAAGRARLAVQPVGVHAERLAAAVGHAHEHRALFCDHTLMLQHGAAQAAARFRVAPARARVGLARGLEPLLVDEASPADNALVGELFVEPLQRAVEVLRRAGCPVPEALDEASLVEMALHKPATCRALQDVSLLPRPPRPSLIEMRPGALALHALDGTVQALAFVGAVGTAYVLAVSMLGAGCRLVALDTARPERGVVRLGALACANGCVDIAVRCAPGAAAAAAEPAEASAAPRDRLGRHTVIGVASLSGRVDWFELRLSTQATAAEDGFELADGGWLTPTSVQLRAVAFAALAAQTRSISIGMARDTPTCRTVVQCESTLITLEPQLSAAAGAWCALADAAALASPPIVGPTSVLADWHVGTCVAVAPSGEFAVTLAGDAHYRPNVALLPLDADTGRLDAARASLIPVVNGTAVSLAVSRCSRVVSVTSSLPAVQHVTLRPPARGDADTRWTAAIRGFTTPTTPICAGDTETMGVFGASPLVYFSLYPTGCIEPLVSPDWLGALDVVRALLRCWVRAQRAGAAIAPLAGLPRECLGLIASAVIDL